MRRAQGERDAACAATALAEARATAQADRARRGEDLVDQLLPQAPALQDLDGTPGVLVGDRLPVLAEDGMVVLPQGVPERSDPAAALQAVGRHADRAGAQRDAAPGGGAAGTP